MEVLKQGQYQPLPIEKEVLIIFAATGGHMDDLPLEQCQRFEQELYRFVDNAHKGMLAKIREKKTLDDDLRNEMKSVILEFKDRFVAEQAAPVTAHA